MKNNNLGELRHKLKGGETETHHIVNLISLIIILKVPIMWSRLEPYRSSIILLVALVIGGLLGIYAPSFASKLQPIGQIFLNLLFMIIVPLVGISVMSSITSMTDLKRLGRIMAIIFIVSIAMAFIPAAGSSRWRSGITRRRASLSISRSRCRRAAARWILSA